ncbi:MAG: hypothetical protein JWO41_490 [Candidatus Saccharibacteria bacterium]|nr:hypothetical protein [Candidatus Saccharibacteria bacterium]
MLVDWAVNLSAFGGVTTCTFLAEVAAPLLCVALVDRPGAGRWYAEYTPEKSKLMTKGMPTINPRLVTSEALELIDFLCCILPRADPPETEMIALSIPCLSYNKLHMRLKIHRRYRVPLSLLLLVALVAGVSIILSSPQHGTPAKIDRMAANKLAPVKPKLTAASTDDQQYFSLQLPAGYTIQSPSGPSGTVLFTQTVIKAGEFGSLLINIGIQKLPEGGLDADPSYHLRSTQTDRYKISQTSAGGEPITLANDIQSATAVAFWVHGPYEATISASQGIGNPATDDNATVIKALQAVLSGWTWK